MNETEFDRDHSASACPACNHDDGFPCSVVTLSDPGLRWLVTYRCPACAHEWRAKQEVPPWELASVETSSSAA